MSRIPSKAAVESARRKRCAFIMLNNGRFALVDKQDLPLVSKWLWTFSNGYAIRRGEKTIKLHRFIMGEPPNHLDHRNRNKLDCRRKNLRPANKSQNAANTGKKNGRYTSTFKGVSWDKTRNLWIAQIRIDGKKQNLGRFTSEVKAAAAYNRAARTTFGEFAYFNPV